MNSWVARRLGKAGSKPAAFSAEAGGFLCDGCALPVMSLVPLSAIKVLRLMAEGTSSRDIADKLGISYTTVRTHIRSLGSKMGVHSKLEAIIKARELALVE